MKKAVIYIYDLIYPELISANYIREKVENAESLGYDEFELHINSGGGSVFEGIAIYNFLKNKKVDVYIDGIAGSIASVVAMAGKKIYMYSSSMLMIHNPWMFDQGEAESLRKTADNLDEIKKAIVEAYMERTGINKAELETMMDDTTWLTAKDAKRKGFADDIIKIKPAKDYVGVFVNLIDDESNNSNKNKGKKMNKAILAFLGLPEDADEKQVLDKIAQLKKELGLDENATLQDVIAKITEAGEEEEEVETETEAASLDPRIDEFLNQQKKDKAESLVDAAISAGKILPAEKEIYLSYALSDYNKMKDFLDKKKNATALPSSLQVNKEGKVVTAAEKVQAAADYFKAQGRK